MTIIIAIFKIFKKSFVKKYNIINFKKVKTIIK